MDKRAHINKYRFIFFELGLIAALSLSLMAFNMEGTKSSGLDESIYENEGQYFPPIDSHVELPPKKEEKKVVKVIRKEKIIDDLRNIKIVDNHIKLVKPILNSQPKTISPLTGTSFVSHKVVKPDWIVEEPDVQAEFPGGASALMAFLQENLNYPIYALEMEAEGYVDVSFVVDQHGNITNIKISEDVVGYGCANEAVRVIQKMPKWKPGIKNGIAVKTRCLQKIRFELSF